MLHVEPQGMKFILKKKKSHKFEWCARKKKSKFLSIDVSRQQFFLNISFHSFSSSTTNKKKIQMERQSRYAQDYL